MSKYNAESFSDNASQSMLNYEQLGSLVSSIFSQIYEQRAAASISKMFYKINDPKYAEQLTEIAKKQLLKGTVSGAITAENAAEIGQIGMSKVAELANLGVKQSNLAKSLSLGYMALTSTGEIYQEAIDGGFDRRTAGLAALMAAGGQYAIMMNNNMGDWFLDKAVGYDLHTSKAAIKKAVNGFFPELESAVKNIDINKTVGKKTLASTLRKIKQSFNKVILEPSIGGELSEQMYKNAIVEGIEEVTEQVVLDATKGIIDTMS